MNLTGRNRASSRTRAVATSFSQAIQNVAYGSEAAQMGAHYPAGR
jgi:hypothetical protein